MNAHELTGSPRFAKSPAMQGFEQTGGRSGWRAVRAATVLVSGALAIAGCVSVTAPDKPIVIQLDINIKQEVVYRLAADAASTIDSHPEVF